MEIKSKTVDTSKPANIYHLTRSYGQCFLDWSYQLAKSIKIDASLNCWDRFDKVILARKESSRRGKEGEIGLLTTGLQQYRVLKIGNCRE